MGRVSTWVCPWRSGWSCCLRWLHEPWLLCSLRPHVPAPTHEASPPNPNRYGPQPAAFAPAPQPSVPPHPCSDQKNTHVIGNSKAVLINRHLCITTGACVCVHRHVRGIPCMFCHRLECVWQGLFAFNPQRRYGNGTCGLCLKAAQLRLLCAGKWEGHVSSIDPFYPWDWIWMAFLW